LPESVAKQRFGTISAEDSARMRADLFGALTEA